MVPYESALTQIKAENAIAIAWAVVSFIPPNNFTQIEAVAAHHVQEIQNAQLVLNSTVAQRLAAQNARLEQVIQEIDSGKFATQTDTLTRAITVEERPGLIGIIGRALGFGTEKITSTRIEETKTRNVDGQIKLPEKGFRVGVQVQGGLLYSASDIRAASYDGNASNVHARSNQYGAEAEVRGGGAVAISSTFTFGDSFQGAFEDFGSEFTFSSEK